jgi:hypothetical protein
MPVTRYGNRKRHGLCGGIWSTISLATSTGVGLRLWADGAQVEVVG